MTWIKIILILSFLAVLVGAFRNRQRVELRAGSRLGGLALCLIAMVSIVDPDIPQRTAEKLGVTRGTDLILYMLVVIFVLTSLGLYFRSRESDRRLLELARAVAINFAVQSDGPPGAHTPKAGSRQEAGDSADPTVGSVREKPDHPGG
jgi:hypothetical protein